MRIFSVILLVTVIANIAHASPGDNFPTKFYFPTIVNGKVINPTKAELLAYTDDKDDQMVKAQISGGDFGSIKETYYAHFSRDTNGEAKYTATIVNDSKVNGRRVLNLDNEHEKWSLLIKLRKFMSAQQKL